MKISSASKKVLASALSAAMVVAFAPTVALAAPAAPTATMTVYKVNAATNATTPYTINFYDSADGSQTGLEAALAAVQNAKTVKADGTTTSGTDGGYILVEEAKGTSGQAGYTPAVYASVKGADIAISGDVAKAIDYSGDYDVTIDLGGNTLSNAATKDEAADDTIDVTGTGTLTLKDGTVSVLNKDANPTAFAAVNGVSGSDWTGKVKAGEGLTIGAIKDAAEVTVAGGALSSIEASKVELSGKATTGAISAPVTVKKGADVTVTATETKDGVSATGIDGTLTFDNGITATKTAQVTVSATAGGTTTNTGSVNATGVTGKVSNLVEGASLTVTADAAGYDADETPTADAVALQNTDEIVVPKGATLKATAASIDGSATAAQSVDAKNGSTVELSAEGKTAATSKAIDGTLKAAAGTYTGKVGAFGTVTGGKYTDSSVKGVITGDYVAEDDGTYWVVSQAKSFKVTGDYGKAGALGITDYSPVTDGVEAMLQDLSAGKTVSGLTLAEGVTSADLLKQVRKLDGSNSSVKAVLTASVYNAKRATDADKAAKAAFDEYNKANLSTYAYTSANLYSVSLTLGYKKTGETAWTTLATVTDLGTYVDGRTTKDQTVAINLLGDDMLPANYTVVAFDGKTVAPMAYDVEDGQTKQTVSTRTIPAAVAVVTTDLNAVKDAASADKPAAAEKATQGIDVDKKSKTVKLAKKASKTKKAQSFNIGATAQTGLTIAKASGSSKVTVSNSGKVTLKKGAKKGTYKATVTIKAAASDQYLAAAKTVTVKFVVKK